MVIFKIFIVLILSSTFWLTSQSPLAAQACQKTFNLDASAQPICLQQIKRSAKNYWEYRVTLKIGDRRKVTRVYDCRSHSYWQEDLAQVVELDKTEQNQLEKYVCRLYRKP